MVEFSPNTERLSPKKPSDRDAFEARCFAIVHEWDEHYFNGAAHITAVKVAHFAHDYKAQGMTVTLGLYNSTTNVIYLNRHIKTLVDMGQAIDELKAVLWHELCHAALINAHQQQRHGLYKPCGGDHGEDFWKTAELNPQLAPLMKEGVIDRVADRIYFRMLCEGKIKNTAKLQQEFGEAMTRAITQMLKSADEPEPPEEFDGGGVS